MSKIYQSPKGRGTFSGGLLLGAGITGMIFLAIPLTQIFNPPEKPRDEIKALDFALPPPPPVEPDPPKPPEPEEQEEPPELEQPPPPISLSQLELALDPGTGGSLTGDFALPSFDAKSADLGDASIFDIGDVDTPPEPVRQGSPKYPPGPRRRGLEGSATAMFVVDENGEVIEVKIERASDPVFEKPTIDAIRNWRFKPGLKDGRTVRTRVRIVIPYRIDS